MSKGATTGVRVRTYALSPGAASPAFHSDAEGLVTELRGKPGKDIALFGGGELFRSLLAAGLVDRVEVALIPVLLGGGIPLLPSPAQRATLMLQTQRLYEQTGTIGLEYDIVRT